MRRDGTGDSVSAGDGGAAGGGGDMTSLRRRITSVGGGSGFWLRPRISFRTRLGVTSSLLTECLDPGAVTLRELEEPETIPEILSTVLRRTLTRERRLEGGRSEVLDSAVEVFLDLRNERSGISGVVGLAWEDILARPLLLWCGDSAGMC